MQTVVIIGPAYPFRGGLSTFNERLAKEFQQQGYNTVIYTFSLQYPSFLFPGKTQYSDEPPPEELKIESKINSINPLNWLRIGNELKNLRPELIVVRFWLPFMGPAFGTILRRARKNRHTRVIAITDNIIPHEKRPGDVAFTKYFLKCCDGFVTMSENVLNDLRRFEPAKPAIQVLHPLYDTFGTIIPKHEARDILGISKNDRVILFFGFIRKYKGLDILFDAIKLLKDGREPVSNLKLLVAGEFYEDENIYQGMIEKAGIRDKLILNTGFIPSKEVRNFFCAADVVVQPYRNATQSGVTPLAYHFEKPMIVTNVGALPNYVPHGKVGLVAEPNAASIAEAIQHYFELGEEYFIPHLRSEKVKYSWGKLTEAIMEVSGIRYQVSGSNGGK